MISHEVILRYLEDARAMIGEAVQLLDGFGNEASVKELKRFYQIIHGLKGTTGMIEGGTEVAAALHTLESRLGCVPLEVSASQLTWKTFARTSLEKADLALSCLVLQITQTHREGGKIAEALLDHPQGVVARVSLKGAHSLLWFPVHVMSRVFAPEEIRGRRMLNLQGAWIPVIGSVWGQKVNGHCYGLGLRVETGAVVVAVEEFIGLSSWREAMETGAAEGLVTLFGSKLAARLKQETGAKPGPSEHEKKVIETALAQSQRQEPGKKAA